MTNSYKKYCPNVFVAKCPEKHEKGDIIIVETRYGKENKHIVWNLVGHMGTQEDPFYLYSITRADGFNVQEHAKRKAERYDAWADSAERRRSEWHEKSKEGADFLALGEPIKIGHHSERRHRNLINRNWNRMGNSVAESKKAEQHKLKTKYWQSKASTINLSMPESVEYFEHELEKAKATHAGIKDGSIPREHDYSLTYAKKKVNDIKKKHDIALKLWG